MRIGFNPNRNQPIENSDYFHQIIIPIYIPNVEGYFADSFKILKLCLESLFKTINSKTYITLVNNGSSDVVVIYLNELFQQNKIHEVIHTTNVGKLNSIIKGISGHKFSIITVSDADVLFLNNWQRSVYDVFDAFPKAGAICTTPSSRSLRTFTANLYWDLFFSNKLKFTDVENPKALKMFAHSVGNENFYNSFQLKKYLTIEDKNIKAVVGGGHFVTTYRGCIFDELESQSADYQMGGNSESKFLDIPVVKKGFWRLSTADNFTYHMGNVVEDWMFDELKKIYHLTEDSSFKLKIIKPQKSQLSHFIKNKLFAKLILNKKIMYYFLLFKGLKKEEAKNYLT